MPQLLHLVDLGEEPMTTQIEAPAVAQDGTADATDDVVGLEDHGCSPRFVSL